MEFSFTSGMVPVPSPLASALVARVITGNSAFRTPITSVFCAWQRRLRAPLCVEFLRNCLVFTRPAHRRWDWRKQMASSRGLAAQIDAASAAFAARVCAAAAEPDAEEPLDAESEQEYAAGGREEDADAWLGPRTVAVHRPDLKVPARLPGTAAIFLYPVSVCVVCL